MKDPVYWGKVLYDRTAHKEMGFRAKEWSRPEWAEWIAGTIVAIQNDAQKSALQDAMPVLIQQIIDDVVKGLAGKCMADVKPPAYCKCFYHEAARLVRRVRL